MHPVFKAGKPKTDTLKCAYLYADGHVVAVFERAIKDLHTRLSYVQIAESIGVKLAGGNNGSRVARVCFHQPAALVAAAALPSPVSIRAAVPTLAGGSEISKRDGIAWGGLVVESGIGWYTDVESSIVSGNVTVQAGTEFEDTWADCVKLEFLGTRDQPITKRYFRGPNDSLTETSPMVAAAPATATETTATATATEATATAN
jgi:prepilin-type processing-associated H-X9-DG protein